MPSLGDSAVIIFLGLLLFGPKGLAQIARQLGKLMGEFRRASNEFRMQMEEELRVSEQADRQREIAAIEAAAPAPPVLTAPVEDYLEEHPHLRAAAPDTVIEPVIEPVGEVGPVPIATSGELRMMPPATGLPAARSSSLAPLLDAVPRVEAPNGHIEAVSDSSLADGTAFDASDQKPMRYTNHNAGLGAHPASDPVDADAAVESVHG